MFSVHKHVKAVCYVLCATSLRLRVAIEVEPRLAQSSLQLPLTAIAPNSQLGGGLARVANSCAGLREDVQEKNGRKSAEVKSSNRWNDLPEDSKVRLGHGVYWPENRELTRELRKPAQSKAGVQDVGKDLDGVQSPEGCCPRKDVPVGSDDCRNNVCTSVLGSSHVLSSVHLLQTH